MYPIVKILVSALIIGFVTEFARRFPTYGGIVAALPIVSLLSVIWLYVQGEPIQTLNKFVLGVITGLPATIAMLLIIALALKYSLHLFVALGLGIGGWILFLLIQDTAIQVFQKIIT